MQPTLVATLLDRMPGGRVSVTDELLANNARYTQTFSKPPPPRPAKHSERAATLSVAPLMTV